jgi:hypothetical protein
MATAKHILGQLGELLVAKTCACPRCKRSGTLKRLPTNFKCADIICDFCGYLAQVKTMSSSDVSAPPRLVIGAAWRVQKERMDSGIYFPLFVVKVDGRRRSVFYLPADLQSRHLFRKRKPLSKLARRAGWQGFMYDFRSLAGAFTRLA